MTNKTLLNLLFSYGNKEFASFSKKLSNSDYEFIGIKIPELRKIIKDKLINEDIELDKLELGKYFEIDFIYFNLNLMKLNKIEDKIIFLEKEISKAKSWMITDSLNVYFNKLKYDLYENFFLNNYNSNYTYLRRMVYVLGIKIYKDPSILNILNYINEDKEYIVLMSQAWLLSFIAIKYQEEVYTYLSNISNTMLKRKTISKIKDSLRFDDNTKKRFQDLINK